MADFTSKQLLLGTTKGLLVYKQEDKGIVLSAIHFNGYNVTMVFADERSDTWWVCVSHKHWGQKIHYSRNNGEQWTEVSIPSFNGLYLPDGQPAKLKNLWCMQHGGFDRPNDLWIGTDPGGLFHSQDKGASWQIVEGLWNHPSRKFSEQWFGAGSDSPFIHSIIVHPDNSDHLYIAVSSAGVFESQDKGATWTPKNKGLVAAYLPNPDTEVGHDPHRLLMIKSNPEILWQQNHCGIFYTKDGGENWIDVSKDAKPNYGFTIVVDQNNPASAWVIPVESDEHRVPPDLRLQVMATSDYGKTWEDASSGLPDQKVFDIVLRQAFDKKENLFAFGTTNGNLYYSMQINNEPLKWKQASAHLTKVNVLIIV